MLLQLWCPCHSPQKATTVLPLLPLKAQCTFSFAGQKTLASLHRICMRL